MPQADDVVPELIQRIGSLEAQLRELVVHIGHEGPRPKDAHKAQRWDVPLYSHISDLRDSLHHLAGSMHILMHTLDQLGPSLKAYGAQSARNSEAISRLTDIMLRVESSVGVLAREKPLLLRDLPRVDTTMTEMTLIVITVVEAGVFSAGTDALLHSALFVSISRISSTPLYWALCCMVLSLISIRAFLLRTRRARMMAALLNTIYFGITGGLTMALQPGIMGWVLQAVGFGLSLWVFIRGPSSAT